jgi:hypothetical protein
MRGIGQLLITKLLVGAEFRPTPLAFAQFFRSSITEAAVRATKVGDE